MDHAELAELSGFFPPTHVKFILKFFQRKLMNDACHAERRKSDAEKHDLLTKLFNICLERKNIAGEPPKEIIIAYI